MYLTNCQQHLGDDDFDARVAYAQNYANNPVIIPASPGEAEKKETSAEIIIDFTRISDFNTKALKAGTKNYLDNYMAPGRVVKHELGHFQFNIKKYDWKKGEQPAGSEAAAQKYESTYDGKPETTKKP